MENFDRENIDELLEIRQIYQYFPCQNFVPYGICMYVCMYVHTYVGMYVCMFILILCLTELKCYAVGYLAMQLSECCTGVAVIH